MITVTRNPNTFTPSENPIIFEFTSDNANLVYYKFELKQNLTPIQTLHLYPTAAYPNKVYVNLSSVLKSYVKEEMKTYMGSLVDYFAKGAFKYNYRVTEMINSSGTITEGAFYNSVATFFVFNGKLDNITFKGYTSNTYAVNNSSIIKFLSVKPNKIPVNDYSNEGLFFLQNNFSNQLSAKYEFYNSNNVLLFTNNVVISGQNTYQQFRINTSLKKLKVDITTLNFNNVAYYTVKLVDSNSVVKSEIKTYIIEPLPCHLHPVNVIWVNKFGVLETVQLYQPEYSFSSSRAYIQQAQYKFDSSGYLSAHDYNVFNIVDRVINSTSEQTIRLNSQPLSDIDQMWLSGIQDSKQIYIQADSDLYIPVTLTDSSYSIKSILYTNEPNVKQFGFKLADGFTPDVPLYNPNN